MPRYFAKQEVVSNGLIISTSTTHMVDSIYKLKKVIIRNRDFLRKKMNTELEDFSNRVRVYRFGRDEFNQMRAIPHGIYEVDEFVDMGEKWATVTRTKRMFIDTEGELT